MNKDRLKELLENVLAWGCEHEDEFMYCLVQASHMTLEEARELGVASYHKDRQYEDLGLPTEARMKVDSCLADSLEDEDYVYERIDEFLSDTYGYTVWDYHYQLLGDKILITDIEWDIDSID